MNIPLKKTNASHMKKKAKTPIKQESVKTPTPPQTIDPSSPPGKGKNSGYKKTETKKEE